MSNRHIPRSTLPLLLAALVGCSGAVPDPEGSDSPYTLSAPEAITIAPGSSGTRTLTLHRTTFDGQVTIRAEGLPSGVTVSIYPTVTTGSSSSMLLILGPTVQPGDYPFTLRTIADGMEDQVVGSVLHVGVSGTYTLSAQPADLSSALLATAAVIIERVDNFTAGIALSVDGAPTGVTVTFRPPLVTGTYSKLGFRVQNSVAPGVYPLNIRGVVAGIPDRITPVTLTVVPSGESSLTAGSAQR